MSDKPSLPSLIASILIFIVFLAFQFWLMVYTLN
jgi:hypothetical protein